MLFHSEAAAEDSVVGTSAWYVMFVTADLDRGRSSGFGALLSTMGKGATLFTRPREIFAFIFSSRLARRFLRTCSGLNHQEE